MGPIVVPPGETLPANVHLFDFTEYYCQPTVCPIVIGNVLVYRDGHHLTATYVKTIAPYLARAIVKVMGWAEPPPRLTPA
jgi:hypothetical protein